MTDHGVSRDPGGGMTAPIRAEIARRWRDRNVPGYWGLNARAWIRLHIRYIRAGYPDGFTVANQADYAATVEA